VTVQPGMTRLLRGLVVVGLLLVACQKDSRLVPATWSLVGEEGKTLQIQYAIEGGCQSFDHVEKSESPSTVRIRVLMRDISTSDDVCTLELGIAKTNVELRQPLGKRKLLGECSDRDQFCNDVRRSLFPR
jgi:hypothetical protein